MPSTASATVAPLLPQARISEYPKLVESCSFHQYDNGTGREEYVLCSGGRQFKVSALARNILQQLDGKTSLEEIAARLNAEEIPITVDQLRDLLEQRYLGLGVIQQEGDPAVAVTEGSRVATPGFPLLLTWDLIPQRVVGWFARGLSTLYAWPSASALLVLIALTHYPVYATDLRPTFTPESYLWIFGLCIVSILIHELGHAAALSRFGGTPGNIGFGLYLLMPTFYADVSQIWRFSRKRRMVVDLGGVYFQQIIFAIFALAGLATGRSELLATCRMIDLMVLMTLNPIFRFDGYWFLVDYLAIPKLHSLALRYPGHLFRRLTGRAVEPLSLPRLGRFAGVVFRSYAFLSSLFLIAIFWIAFRSLSVTLSHFPTAVPEALRLVVLAAEAGDVLLLLSRILAFLLLIAFPGSALIGIGLYIAWILRWCSGRLQRALSRSTPEGAL